MDIRRRPGLQQRPTCLLPLPTLDYRFSSRLLRIIGVKFGLKILLRVQKIYIMQLCWPAAEAYLLACSLYQHLIIDFLHAAATNTVFCIFSFCLHFLQIYFPMLICNDFLMQFKRRVINVATKALYEIKQPLLHC